MNSLSQDHTEREAETPTQVCLTPNPASFIIQPYGSGSVLARARALGSLLVKLLGGASGGSEVLRFFMSQHRKNSARSKVIDKK